MLQNKVLLIGNGPAALARKVGKEIDSFDGIVARFNNYTTKGFEEFVGSRTDMWITNSEYPPNKLEHEHRLFFSWRDDDATTKCYKKIKANRIPIPYGTKTTKIMKFNCPSLGAIATTWLISQGHDIELWGFDFLESLRGRKHHYNEDGQVRGNGHKTEHEWYFFHRCEHLGLIKWFGVPMSESLPRVRENNACGRNGSVEDSREAAHSGWYKWFGESCKGKTVLDVGAGMGAGMKVLKDCGATKVVGIDVDQRLREFGVETAPLENFPNNSFDIVTSVEVLEHVTEDLTFMNHLKRIAKEKVMITTPSFMRSRCWNHAHCREYTIPQFTNIFKPDEVWSAAPSGTAHRTLLLRRNAAGYIDYSPEGLMNQRKRMEILPYYMNGIPWNLPFDQTVDGEEWPCICGIFNVGG